MNNFEQEKSFKEQILAEMQEASRQREARRQELLAQEAQARQEAEEAAKLAEEARLEAERQAQLAAERQAQLEAEEARRRAELEELARQEEAARLEAERQAQLAEEEARRQAEAEAARLEEERRRAEEEARLEAERQAQLVAEEARRQAELEELARQEEELRRLEEEARLEAERQAAERQARQEELLRRQAELEAARQNELSRIEAEERELARLEEARQRHLEELARLEAEQAQLAEIDFAEQEVTWEENLDDTISETAIPTFQEEEVTPLAELPATDDQEWDEEDVLEPEDKELSVAEQRRKNNQVANKISLFLGTIIVLMILATGIFGYRYVSSAIKPMDSTSTEFVQVEIPNGSGNKLIGQILEENGVIKSGAIFNYYTKFKNYTNFQSGYYNFQKSMSLDEISQLLQEGGTPEPVVPALGKIAIPEGYTLTQISEAVAKNSAAKEGADNSTPFTSEDFMAVVQDENFIARMIEKYPLLLSSLPDASLVKYQLEGYLFPATYSYYEESTMEDIVEQMLAAMDSNLAVYYDTIANSGRTVNDVLTLASLVEKEGATDGDRKMIASVFYNRLSINMPLQSNIAILYAMDQLGEKTTLLEDATIDTAIDSPYNIYQNYGLMPGPVDSAGLSAIQATIEPDNTDYLYFVADVTTGQVYYAETYEEHTANVEQYVNSNL